MIAILLYTHKNLKQTRRLINSLKHDKVDIYLHVDKKCKLDDSFDDVYLLKRHNVRWGGESQVQAVFESLREIESSNKEYSHYVFMSGQDYLIKPISYIVDYLEKNMDKNYLEYREISDKDKDIRNRFVEYRTGRRYVDAILRRILPARKIFFGQRVYYGSCWWILTDKAVKYMISKYFSKYHKKLFMTVCIDEIIYQTILVNSDFKKSIVNDNKRYIDWSDHKKGLNDGNPNILVMADYDKIVSSGKFIARKFDISKDDEVMDMLDKYRGEL